MKLETGANMRPKMAFAGGGSWMQTLGRSEIDEKAGAEVLGTGRALPVAGQAGANMRLKMAFAGGEAGCRRSGVRR